MALRLGSQGEARGCRKKAPATCDNRPGAGGNIGAEITAKSPPDGYMLLIANNSLITNASLYRKLPYDPFRARE
jgi:tripartite-type tricarboxylate transporter receptor subunit TctC